MWFDWNGRETINPYRVRDTCAVTLKILALSDHPRKLVQTASAQRIELLILSLMINTNNGIILYLCNLIQ